jgi:MFS transporter, DHA1 family, tetracycline resistance protein
VRKLPPTLPVFLIVLVDVLGLTMLIPLLPFYAQTFGATEVQVGALMAVYAACSLVAGPPLGALSDKYGRKPVLLVSQLGTFLGLIMLAYAPSLWIVFLSRIIDGATAGNITVAQAFIADVTRPADRAKKFAIIGISFGIGFLIGPAATSFIAAAFGDRAAILAAAGLSFLSIVTTLLLLPMHPQRPAPEPGDAPAQSTRRPSPFDLTAFANFFKRPELAPLLWQYFAFSLSFSFFMGGFALFAERRFMFGTKEVSYVLTYAGFLGVIVQGGLLQRLIKLLGETKLAFIGFAATVLSQVLLGAAYSIPMLYLSTTVLSAAGFLRPVLSSLISRRTGPHEQGAVIGVTQSLMSVSQIIGPLTASWMIGQGGWWVGGSAFAAAGIAFVGLVMQRRATVQAAAV